MELKEFATGVPGFARLSNPDKIIHFGWFLHHHKSKSVFTQLELRNAYRELHMEPPNLSDVLTRMLSKRPKVILQEKAGYKLEHSVREHLDKNYGEHETTIALSQLLKELPGKLSDEAERFFLSEAIKCYHVRAFRAAIVMVWNLTYDHLLHWILADPARLTAFQSHIAGRVGPKKAAAITITRREDFEDLKESETLDICSTAGLFVSRNTKQILDIQLTKRNLAAHPSLVTIGAPEAEDTISSLIQNVVLVLK